MSGPGDEVILPPYTFVATFNAITASYALPVFVDSNAATFQIDETKIEAAITPPTKVLLPVRLAGSTCEIEAIATIAKRRGLTQLEDACQAPLAERRGQPIGTHGIGGCFSFQASKKPDLRRGRRDSHQRRGLRQPLPRFPHARRCLQERKLRTWRELSSH